MTPIGDIADAGSTPAISTKSALWSSYVLVAGKVQTRQIVLFRRGCQGFDVVGKERTTIRYGKPTLVVMQYIIDDLFIDIDALEAVTA